MLSQSEAQYKAIAIPPAGLISGTRAATLKALQLIGVMALLQLVIAFFTEPLLILHEEAMWQYIGRNWLRWGLIPYSGGVDNKSPLIFFVFGISDKLFGVNYWFPRLLGTAVQSLGVFYLFKIAEKTMNARAGMMAITFYGLSLLWKFTGGKYVSFTETYAVTAIIMAAYFCIVLNKNSNGFLGGLLAALGLGFRFSAIFAIIPITIFSFKKNRLSAVYFLAGLITGTALLLLLISLAGIRIQDFLFYGFADNFGAGSPTGHSLAWKAQGFADSFFYSELILFYPFVTAYCVITRKIDFITAWLIAEFTGIVLLGIFARNHSKDLLPAMSLMSAAVMNQLVTQYALPVKKLLLGIWIVFFPKTFEPLFALKKLIVGHQDTLGIVEDESLKKNLGWWIKDHTVASDRVFIAGFGAQIQVYSARLSPGIYFNVTQTAAAKKQLFADLIAQKPAMIVIPLSQKYNSEVSAGIRDFIDGFVARSYQLDTSLYGYNIFRYKRNTGQNNR